VFGQAAGLTSESLMRQSQQQLIERTLEVWQPRTPRTLTTEDARQIAENVVGFFGVLLEWEAAESETAPLEGPSVDAVPGLAGGPKS